MKRYASIFFILFTVIAVAGCTPRKSAVHDEKNEIQAPNPPLKRYTTFKSSDGLFSVEIPLKYETMHKQTQELKTAAGKIPMEIYSTDGDDIVFMASASKFLLADAPRENIKEALERGVAGLIGDGVVLKKKKSALDGHEGIMVRYRKTANGTDVYDEFIIALIGSTQYQLQVLAFDKDKLDEQDSQHFLKSFKYLGSAAKARP